MQFGKRVGTTVLVAGMVAAGTAASPPTAGASGNGSWGAARVIAQGLDGPFGLAGLGHRRFVVAESVSGEVTVIGRRG